MFSWINPMKPEDLQKLIVIFGSFAIIIGGGSALVFSKQLGIDGGARDSLIVLVTGTGVRAWQTVETFLFGSSLGSRNKDQALINQP